MIFFVVKYWTLSTCRRCIEPSELIFLKEPMCGTPKSVQSEDKMIKFNKTEYDHFFFRRFQISNHSLHLRNYHTLSLVYKKDYPWLICKSSFSFFQLFNMTDWFLYIFPTKKCFTRDWMKKKLWESRCLLLNKTLKRTG